MRIVVMSDSHGSFHALQEIVLAQPTAGLFLFLGDGLREFEDICVLYPDKVMQGVRGNCDWSSDAKIYDTAFCEGKKILITHGHTCQVKRSLDPLIAHADEQSADIALFGHTHAAMTGYVDGLYLMNPGSCAQPRDGGRPSYGIIDITSAGTVTSIVRL